MEKLMNMKWLEVLIYKVFDDLNYDCKWEMSCASCIKLMGIVGYIDEIKLWCGDGGTRAISS